MIDIDRTLARMPADPLPPGLDAIDTDVMAAIAHGAAPAIGTGAGLLAVMMAAGLGMAAAGGGRPPQSPVAPFGLDGVQAPSRLLGGDI